MSDVALALVPSSDRIMNAAEIAKEKLHGQRTKRWVLGHVPGRIPGAKPALWFESVVDRYLASLRRESVA